MATLQASLRGRTISQSESLAEMVALINRLLYDASASNRYATFFYAQYYPKTRLLCYVNAGHNAPIVCRPNGNGQTILRLEEGGTVIGIFQDSLYKEESLQLERGDMLVAFTDGISEAENAREEEWDEERLIAAVREFHSLTAAEAIVHILERVDNFTAGVRQHDDMTLVVVRVQ